MLEILLLILGLKYSEWASVVWWSDEKADGRQRGGTLTSPSSKSATTDPVYVFNGRPPHHSKTHTSYVLAMDSKPEQNPIPQSTITEMKGPSRDAVHHAISILLESLNANNQHDYETSVIIVTLLFPKVLTRIT